MFDNENLNSIKKNILLYGGAFDPFHNGHLNTIKYCLDNLKFDEIWLILTFKNADGKKLSFWKHRLKILEIGLKNSLSLIEQKKVKIELYEVKNQGISYTLNTVEAIKAKYSVYDFSFIMGDDVFLGLETWTNYDKFIALCNTIYILNRGRSGLLCFNNLYNNLNYVNKFSLLNNNIWDFSSTDIRKGLYLEQLDSQVLDYCNEHGLYFYNRIKYYLSNYRVEHSFNVAAFAIELGQFHDLSINECYVAAILHDIAKEMPQESLNWYLNKYDKEHSNVHPAIKHQYVSKIIAKEKFLIKNERVLNAIANHTSPADLKNLDKLSKVIYLADKLSEDRNFQDIEEFRQLAREDLENAFIRLYEKLKYKSASSKEERVDLKTKI